MRLADSASPVGRNITYNLTGYMVPLAAALVATPFLIRGYGAERFGVLTLAWALVSYAGVLDLGTGRALIKLVAEHRAAGKNDSLGRLLGTASWLLFGFGFASGVLLFIGAEPLVEHVLRVSPTLRAETARGIQILAVSVPVVMLAVGCRSLLEGLERFDLVNLVRVPSATVMFLGPLIALTWSESIVWALTSLAVARALALAAYYALVKTRDPFATASSFQFHASVAREILRVGGWMTVSSMIAPMLLYIDRFVIVGLLNVEQVAYYVTPFEVLARLSIFPVAIMGVMFPAFSSRLSARDANLLLLYRTSSYGIAALLGVAAVLVVLFADPILTLWLGAELAAESADVTRILAVGFALHGLAQSPFHLLQAAGRPDITAKLHLIEAPFYLGYLLLLTSAFGITGTAVAWSIRVGISATVLTVLAQRLVLVDCGSTGEHTQ